MGAECSTPPLSPGIYLAHKPAGPSSFDIVRAYKRVAFEGGQKKWALGHGGTLDPFARGLLLILSGQATRLMGLLHPLPKVYEADVEWGAETDTGDALGRALFEGDARGLTEAALDGALGPFLGWTEQVPPATSAKKIDGEAAYKKARRGESVEMRPSRVYLHEAAWASHSLPFRSRLKITCRGGYYVRSLARDLGRALGCGAHLSGLYRAAIGPFGDPGEGRQELLTGAEALSWCPSRFLGLEEADHLACGRPIEMGEAAPSRYSPPDGFPGASTHVAAIFQSKLVALLVEREGRLWTVANLRGGI
jgi:tRNA pseudouridine55 synthase